jgi:DNA polymerase III gamma/tau subunit
MPSAVFGSLYLRGDREHSPAQSPLVESAELLGRRADALEAEFPVIRPNRIPHMKRTFVSFVCAAVAIGVMALSSTASFAQQKTVKQCTEEWQKNKAANQAAGIKLDDYVAKCRAGGAAAQPSTPPTPAPAPAAAAPKPAPTPAPAAAAPKPAPAPAAIKPAPAAATAPTGANQFATEAQAKARCPAGTVVWVNLDSKIYHFSGSSDYGHTKAGAYMCENDTAAAGARAAKNEKHP